MQLVLSGALEGLYFAIALAGLIGAITALTTRDDAFTAGDRYPKFGWVGMLLAASACVAIGVPFLSWVGIVLVGVYWFDVRPQIKDMLSGNYWN
ncbi:DUF2516 family protein [Corynebacterium sp.]|uniref:DUF2516 family protein n=1 Tax=Corynebacterium sp. TaxID=1720 RepID=UPI0026DC72B2|nr:DUF2516 family protein [Corynebacterium sp.]MDO5077808.1 DUF2516 family protein [Corynebacterium sp.]